MASSRGYPVTIFLIIENVGGLELITARSSATAEKQRVSFPHEGGAVLGPPAQYRSSPSGYSFNLLVQESLANAKVSARQPRYVRRNSLNRPPFRIAYQYQRNLYIVEKYFQCSTIPSPTMWVYLHLFSRRCLPNMPTSAKFREHLNVQQLKVIQGR